MKVLLCVLTILASGFVFASAKASKSKHNYCQKLAKSLNSQASEAELNLFNTAGCSSSYLHLIESLTQLQHEKDQTKDLQMHNDIFLDSIKKIAQLGTNHFYGADYFKFNISNYEYIDHSEKDPFHDVVSHFPMLTIKATELKSCYQLKNLSRRFYESYGLRVCVNPEADIDIGQGTLEREEEYLRHFLRKLEKDIKNGTEKLKSLEYEIKEHNVLIKQLHED